jgi:DNA polymerase III epsilon subunit-like protein
MRDTDTIGFGMGWRMRLKALWPGWRPLPALFCGPPPHPLTRLADVSALVLDTETTGLNVRGDRVISAAGFELRGGVLAEEPLFDLLIDPERPIPPASTAFHGITMEKVRGAGNFARHWPALYRGLGAGIVVGHQIYFDIAILRREVLRLGHRLQPPMALDTALLFTALHPSAEMRDLTPCCESFGIEITGRHTAAGDALAAGRLFQRLVPLLADHGIHTLGEALAFERAAFAEHPRRWHW